ncbi:MAG: RelA/SpoT domain-containing protein [Solirubrobacterales bacterium]
MVAGYSKEQIKRAGDVMRRVEDATAGEFAQAIRIIDGWRAGHAKPLARVNAGLRYYVRKVGVEEPEVTQRLKRFATVVDKLRREPRMALSRMEDIGGVRAIMPKQTHVDAVVKDIRSQPRWKIRRVREYVEGRKPGPKSDGYRAVHIIVEKDGCYVEMQLRTPWQDAWAQSVEQDTRRLGAGLKFGAGPVDLREYYVMISEFFAMRERMEEPSNEFMEQLAEKFTATRVYFPDAGEGS